MRVWKQNSGSAATFLLAVLVVFGIPAYLATHGIPTAFNFYLGKPIGEIRARGLVERRHPYSPAFLPVKSGDPIYLGDVIYTGPRSEALVMLSGGRALEILPSTLVTLAAADINSVDTNVYLGQVRSGGSRPYSLRSSDIRGLDAPVFDLFKYLSGSKYAVAGSNRPTAVGALYDRMVTKVEGAVDAVAGKKKRLPASVGPVSSSRLAFLAPDAKELRVRKNKRTELKWKQLLKGVTYVVEVAPNQDFSGKIVERTKRTSTSLRLHKEGTYYVRVRTVVRGQWVSTPVKTFTVTD